MRKIKISQIEKKLEWSINWGKYKRNPNYVAGEKERRKYIRSYWKYEKRD